MPYDKVLDIGSGNIPFKYATHLADLSLDDGSIGRANSQFKYINGKQVFQCDIENMLFKDNEFDFVYCSHVLEHVQNPEKACKELIRVGKRGFIDTPTKGKDIWLNTAKISNHRWWIEKINEKLIFTKYKKRELSGFESNILLSMHSQPQTPREKAFSALIYLKADLVNNMLLWDSSFEYEVRS
ncbi:MAG: class I SAM-dependent methyltransferase [Candidatus Magnetomorum sp.]|nr:class I SAM-dependent methyltransferase [Candidatus Magnetomorum sp.]